MSDSEQQKSKRHRSHSKSKSKSDSKEREGSSSSTDNSARVNPPNESLEATVRQAPIPKLVVRTAEPPASNPQLDMVIAALQSTSQQMAAMVSAMAEAKQPSKPVIERKWIYLIVSFISYDKVQFKRQSSSQIFSRTLPTTVPLSKRVMSLSMVMMMRIMMKLGLKMPSPHY